MLSFAQTERGAISGLVVDEPRGSRRDDQVINVGTNATTDVAQFVEERRALEFEKVLRSASGRAFVRQYFS